MRVINISLYPEMLLVTAVCMKLWLYHTKINKSKTDYPQTAGQLEKTAVTAKQREEKLQASQEKFMESRAEAMKQAEECRKGA